MKNEERYGQKIRQALNHSVQELPLATTRRLEAARHLALEKQKQPQTVFAIANTAGVLLRLNAERPLVKQALAIFALLLGMWISFYFNSVQYVNEVEEIDSALLSDDMPPEAFMDKDFFEWLKDDSPEE